MPSTLRPPPVPARQRPLDDVPAQLDPEALIEAARRRQRRRRTAGVALVAAAVAAAVGVYAGFLRTTSTRPGPSVFSAAGFCARLPSGWQARITRPGGVPTLSLTSFRFGREGYLGGHDDPALRWPPGGTLITIYDWTRGATAAMKPNFVPVARPPQLAEASYSSFEGIPVLGRRMVSLRGHLLEVWVQSRPTTPATIAAANRALAGVRLCG